MEILSVHIFSVMIAVVAFIYSDVLTESGMILNGLFRAAEQTLPSYIFKPLIGCFKCVAGQIALWFYLINADDFGFFQLVYMICLTILFSQLICRLYRGSH
jgi:hypothetical protein